MLGAVGMELGGTTGDRYRLRRLLGSGNFGDAWEAHDQDEDDQVAVKLLDPRTRPDDVLREASLQRRLSEHARIVALRNVDLGANPSSFVVTELIRGGSLKDVLDVRRPTVREAHRWLRDVLEALAHAHRLSVFHRDVKPSNLLLGADGHALLTDFGVAEDSIRTPPGTLGMYNEILPPEGTAATSSQTDIWLVGILGWHLLAGERPDLAEAHGGTVELVHRRSPEVPIALSRAIAAAMAPNPAERPTSIERLLELIGAVRVRAGWHDVQSTDPAVVRAWKGDDALGAVEVEIRHRPRGGFLVQAHAAPGRRLRSLRRATVPTEARALQQARSWLEPAVRGVAL
jgi:serine/threonine-protein kinase